MGNSLKHINLPFHRTTSIHNTMEASEEEPFLWPFSTQIVSNFPSTSDTKRNPVPSLEASYADHYMGTRVEVCVECLGCKEEPPSMPECREREGQQYVRLLSLQTSGFRSSETQEENTNKKQARITGLIPGLAKREPEAVPGTEGGGTNGHSHQNNAVERT